MRYLFFSKYVYISKGSDECVQVVQLMLVSSSSSPPFLQVCSLVFVLIAHVSKRCHLDSIVNWDLLQTQTMWDKVLEMYKSLRGGSCPHIAIEQWVITCRGLVSLWGLFLAITIPLTKQFLGHTPLKINMNLKITQFFLRMCSSSIHLLLVGFEFVDFHGVLKGGLHDLPWPLVGVNVWGSCRSPVHDGIQLSPHCISIFWTMQGCCEGWEVLGGNPWTPTTQLAKM